MNTMRCVVAVMLMAATMAAGAESAEDEYADLRGAWRMRFSLFEQHHEEYVIVNRVTQRGKVYASSNLGAQWDGEISRRRTVTLYPRSESPATGHWMIYQWRWKHPRHGARCAPVDPQPGAQTSANFMWLPLRVKRMDWGED